MELTLENLIDEIVDREHIYHTCMINSGSLLGEDSADFKKWKDRWTVLYNLAVKFDFVDKLKR